MWLVSSSRFMGSSEGADLEYRASRNEAQDFLTQQNVLGKWNIILIGFIFDTNPRSVRE